MSGAIPPRDQKILCTRSGNRCALSDCHKELVKNKTENDPESMIGVMAHIKGEKEGASRYDPNMTDKERQSYENLILLCGSCHKIIDDQPNKYTVEELLQIKRKHEKWIVDSTKEEVVNVSFVELSVVTKYLVSGQAEQGSSYTIIPPKEKIKKNNLSGETEALIKMGMTQVKQVENFIDKCPDVEFGERLKQGFVREYERLRSEEGLSGDQLFDALLHFSSGSSGVFKERAAGLAVLVHLFEKCEVFEQ